MGAVKLIGLDFGTTTSGKLSARYEVTDNLAFRSTVSTGFRAPTPGQSAVCSEVRQVRDG